MEVADLPNDKKKITITIAYNRFTVLSSEDEAYSRTLAEEVDRSIRELSTSGRISVTAAAMLTAMNFRDEVHKREKDIELLKKQLSTYLEELVRANEKNREQAREAARLRSDLARLRRRLSEESPTINEKEPLSPAIRLPRKAVTVTEGEEAAEDLDGEQTPREEEHE